ncbi:MAG: mechanosensitive ion channel family protein [Candidatus Micrarchaeota archaeon]|nr:mechanosensitive ion channel family protein [Candidatus Micrarchaeota archaeon]
MIGVVNWIVSNYVKLAISAIIVVIGIAIGSMLSVAIRRRMHKDYSIQTAKLAGRAVYYVVSAIAIIAALGNLGVNLGSALVAGGFLGIVVGFAAQSSFSNLIAGVFLMIDKPFKISDYIGYDNMSLQVIDVGFFSTKAATWDGMQLRIPNNQLFNSNITNYTRSVARLVSAQFTLIYEEDLNRVIPRIISAFKEQWFVLIEPAPQAFATEFSDKGVTIEVRVWTAGSTWGDLYFSMIGTIAYTLKDLKVKFAYPRMMYSSGSSLKLQEKTDSLPKPSVSK